MLNAIWLALFAIAAATATGRWLVAGDAAGFAAIVASLFEMARLSVEIMLTLFGTLALWLGFLRIAEHAGLIDALARLLGPLFARLMPGVPRGHPALGLVTLNFAANGLGLDNAATPIGLRAMRELQSLNPNPETATDAQILFLVLNSSSLTLLPVTILLYRLQQGAPEPALVFVPILLATAASTLAGLLAVAAVQRLRLGDAVVLAWLGGTTLALATMVAALRALPAERLSAVSTLAGNVTIVTLVLVFLAAGARRRVPVYECFIDGARQGFEVARDLLPFLVAMLAAVGALRASGALDMALDGVRALLAWTGWDARFVDALPTALAKPFSGSAARALLIETMHAHGVDSFAARLAAVVQGSTDTTFYVLAVYFGAVGVRRIRHALGCALVADAAGIAAAIAVSYAFFG